MSTKFRAGQSPRGGTRLSFTVERLESRDLLSVLPISGRSLGAHHAAPASALTQTTQAPAGRPTPHEVAREHFVGKLATTYDVGPGRFTDQASSIFYLGSGGSSMASHTYIQMIAFTPTSAVNGTITGQAGLMGRNVGTSGTVLGLNLMGDPTSLFHGLPTHYTWVVNGSSSGLFSGATGQGTLDVHYIPGGKVPPRAFAAGKAYITIQGMINTVGSIYNDLALPGNRPAHS